MHISSFLIQEGRDSDYAALSDLMDVMRAERVPDEPSAPLSERQVAWRSVPELYRIRTWLAWEDGQAVGRAEAGYPDVPENAHLLHTLFEVHPAHRRRGLGRTLLAEVVTYAETLGRRSLLLSSVSNVPDGEAFLQRIGARPALEMRVSRLELADVDAGLLDRWLEAGPAADFELGFWTGVYPDEHLEDIARLYDILNTAPRGELEVEDVRTSAEELRQRDRSFAATGQRRWVAYALERASGRFVGFTELDWHPARPGTLSQGATGVFPEFRGRGLGRWLKAAMLRRVMLELPEARRIETGNAQSNAPMLAINVALGFRPHRTLINWQLEVEQARRYLDG
ncbi:GNAT superfamily N-acetyltransferase [Deinobacterium chartae]|uniref:GNAT superfamily N-acetyltransferase n=1 Tax=Deinobacterium chartae TaxID=521158 RepID=A0A841HZN7_9DEIO|nr:GNAT family N-acetyltransferase [Deinobacterium chartae]MBB6098991.1 GNAT superfamily N-acetyltransferase [Deinobacterium chartae]